ncbi:MAG: orotate phosphoribosyltransferase [Desulfovibrio sp.]|nr:MAG: orotate phosphoribosyltransferase [Desulfovibrio sp.]
MNEIRKQLARLLLEKSYKEGDFVLTSGRKSEYYFDCKQTALHPEGAYLLALCFLDLIQDLDAEVAGVGGMTLGADPLVSSVSVVSHIEAGKGGISPLPAFIIRKKSKGHGTNQYLEGMANFESGAKVVLLEDVVTTGGTLITSCERVKDAGLEVAGVICVLDREEGGRENLAQAGYELTSIFTRQELLNAGA